MKCKQHPRYVPKRAPVKSVNNPDGCPTCLGIWEHAKADPKGLAAVIEVPVEEARVMIHTLEQAIRSVEAGTEQRVVNGRTMVVPRIDARTRALLQTIYTTLTKAYREAQLQ